MYCDGQHGHNQMMANKNVFNGGREVCPWLRPTQHIHKPNHVCQPVGECEYLYQLPLFLLVDTQGLVCKCAGQAFAKGNFVPPFFRFLSYIFLLST